MAITDKTRKMLWGRAGNRCAICRRDLVISKTASDEESIVGDECHIISSHANGPRHEPSYPKVGYDTYDNLILLCRNHHKMIDDQWESYSVDYLRRIKSNHELWVSQRLTDYPKSEQIKIRRIKKNIPAYLVRYTTGRELLNLLLGVYAINTNYDEPDSQEEVKLVGEFLQSIKDLLDIGNDLEYTDQVKESFNLTKSLENLEQAGFFVLGAREIQLLKGETTELLDWPVAYISILRKENSEIMNFDPSRFRKA
ncbi:HNH endonuclease [Chloroflexota bacterium]